MMKLRSLFAVLFLAALVWLFWPTSPSQDVKVRAKSSIIPSRSVAAVSSSNSQLKQPQDELVQSGLSQAKVQAICDLRDFHSSHPVFNHENILKRQALLEELARNSHETVKAFGKIMRESKDDGLKSFLLNLVMGIDMPDEDKAEIFMARILAGSHFSREGIVPDEELSIMISFSHLSRLEDEQVKTEAIEKLKSHQEFVNNPGFQKAFRDYLGQ